MTDQTQAKARTYRCRQKGCPNQYTDVLGGENAFGKRFAGADCLPCFFAAEMIENGQTPEQIETVPAIRAQFDVLLANTGWNWDQVRAAFTRNPVHR